MGYLWWLGVSAICFAVGEYWSKRFADEQRTLYVGYLLAAYLMSSVLWLPAITQRNHLALVGTIWSLVTLLATVIMGVFLFGEKLAPTQWAGVVLAVLAIALLNWDPHG